MNDDLFAKCVIVFLCIALAICIGMAVYNDIVWHRNFYGC